MYLKLFPHLNIKKKYDHVNFVFNMSNCQVTILSQNNTKKLFGLELFAFECCVFCQQFPVRLYLTINRYNAKYIVM